LIWLPGPAELLIRLNTVTRTMKFFDALSIRRVLFHGEIQPTLSPAGDSNLNHILGKEMTRTLFHELDQNVN
jgi:hypothetical protein